MNVTFYRNSSTPNTVNKRIASVVSYTGTLRDNADLVNPVIRFDTLVTSISDANYAYIPEMGNRYYYIVGVRVITNRLIEVSFHCDVLMTYKSQFLQWTGVATRQENQYNLYLNDNRFICQENPIIGYENFPNGLTTDSWVLAIAG